jgi:hypothetical protein
MNYFKSVQVNSDVDMIVWDNGADLSHNFLEIRKPVGEPFVPTEVVA